MDLFNKFANQASGQQQNHPPQQQQQQQQSAGADQLLGKLGSFVGGSNQQHTQQQQVPQQASGSSSLFDKLHGAAGGGPESEKKEDALDKGIDFVQEKFFGKGPQNNEHAAEQAQDKLIAQTIRDQYKKATGNEFPIKEKEEKKSSFGSAFGL